jgi:hypothetical protein
LCHVSVATINLNQLILHTAHFQQT